MKENGIKVEEEDVPIVAEDDSLLMEEFETRSEDQLTQADKNAEEELVYQLEDFETLRENMSDDEGDNDREDEGYTEAEAEEEQNEEKENDKPNKGKKMGKIPSRRQIQTSEGVRSEGFGIVGKGLNDKDVSKDSKSKPVSKDLNVNKDKKKVDPKDKDKKKLKEKELDTNVMITGNQLRPSEIVFDEKSKKQNQNQKSIIGWFYKHKK